MLHQLWDWLLRYGLTPRRRYLLLHSFCLSALHFKVLIWKKRVIVFLKFHSKICYLNVKFLHTELTSIYPAYTSSECFHKFHCYDAVVYFTIRAYISVYRRSFDRFYSWNRHFIFNVHYILLNQSRNMQEALAAKEAQERLENRA